LRSPTIFYNRLNTLPGNREQTMERINNRKNIIRMKKTYFFLSLPIIIISLTLLLLGYACQRQTEKTYVIGYINPNPDEEEGAQGFLRNMPKFGFIEGKNTTYMKFENRDLKNMEAALREMSSKPVDLIFAMTTPAVKLAEKATKRTDIPVIFIQYDAVRSGVVKSLTRPDGNITGIELRGSTQKSLEFLRAIVPDTKHLFVPVKFDTGGAYHSLEDLKQEAARFGLDLTVAEVATKEALRSAMSSMPGDADAIFLLHSWLVGSNVDIVMDNAIKRKIPVFSAGHVDFKNGLVLSYAPMDDRTGLQAARMANSILNNGVLPADLPVETADFFLGINLKTARSIGLEIPNEILEQADFIVR
jgi:putative ABC transport system substrate-binding protein